MKIGIEEIKKLKERKGNPNRMSKEQIEALKKSITKFGELQPIIIDQNNLIIDGHQRVEAYKQLNKTQIPVIKLNLTKESDKLILSQVMNRLKGNHVPELDAAEYKRILSNAEMEDLTSLTAISEQEILNAIENAEREPNNADSEERDKLYGIEIECPKCHHKWKKRKVKDDNRIENLRLFKNQSEHMKFHYENKDVLLNNNNDKTNSHNG